MSRSGSLFLPSLVLICGILMAPAIAKAQPPRTSVMAGESLIQTRITLSVDAQAIGELLPKLLPAARQSKIPDHAHPPSIRSLWLDRQVDSDAPVSLTEASTPTALVILKVAEMNDLAVFPLPGVLVIGRPDWVDSTISHLAAPDKPKDDFISIRWPSGSTAAEVLALMLTAPSQGQASEKITNLADAVSEEAGNAASHQVSTWLPHDIWASGSLIGVDRTLAVGLLLAQFQCSLKPGTRLESLAGGRSSPNSDAGSDNLAAAPEGVLSWAEMPPASPFLLAYPAGDSALALRNALTKVHPRPSIRVSNKQLLINTTAPNHRLGISLHWRSAAANPPGAAVARNDSTSVFDLKLVDKPAAEVIGQLAQVAGKKFRIETGADSIGDKLVTLDAKKETLEQLAQLVAEAANGNVDWGDAEVVLSMR